ncbi:VOC family protein [Streptomyces sp. NPDC047108]|uniref:VOC family protein n=1 Tax=Streptomyces sp. NPDC047108 TaxID=3155025 RepID=UPI0033CFA60C
MTDETLERHRTRPPTPTTLWPTLTYRDARAAIRFLTEALGFETTALYTGETEDEVVHAELRRPDGAGIMLGSIRQDSVICALPPGTGSVYVVTDEPDAAYARATAAGAVVVQGLEDTDYGSRGFTVRDPEGVFWSFGTYAGA